MNCQKCLTVLPQGAVYCTRCGSSQSKDRSDWAQITQIPFPPSPGQSTPSSFLPPSVRRAQSQFAPASANSNGALQLQDAQLAITDKTKAAPRQEYVAATTPEEYKEEYRSEGTYEYKEMYKVEGKQEGHKEAKEEDGNERLMVFSDGIIAFALTVAAITIKIPASVEQLQANQFSIIFRCFMYIIAFLIVAGAWFDHHTIFHHIKQNNIVLVILNFFYLAAIVLFPIGLFFLEFGIELVNANSDVGVPQALLGVGIFLGSQIMAGLALVWMWRYANKRARLTEAEVGPRLVSYMTRRLLSKSLLYILAVVLIFVAAASPSPVPYILLALFLVVMIGRIFYFRFYGRGLDLSRGADDTKRIQLFSDAVIGISITLAVAQIEFPSLGEDNKGALEAVDHQWPLLHAFLVGIVVMGVYWLFHYHLFRFIKRHDGWLIWLNNLFLLSVALMLVSINWFVNYYDKPEMYAHFYFGFWQILTSLVLVVMWWHVSRKKRLLAQDTPDERIKQFGLMVVANPLVFLALTILSGFIPSIMPSVYIGMYLALLSAIWLFSRWNMKRQAQNTHPAQLLV